VLIQEVIADPCNGIIGVPEQFYYMDPINMLEMYSNGNIELAQKHVSPTWGDCSFTLMHANMIDDLTAANGFIDATGDLTDSGKELVLKRMHYKFLCYHLLELLTDLARQAIEQQSSLYTWISTSETDEEVDRITILALIHTRI
jgi:hypothetical protein